MFYLRTSVLKTVREKPGMTFSGPAFSGLCNYVQGVYDSLQIAAPEHPLYLELVGFNDWLASKFSRVLPSRGWQQIIEELVPDDKERVGEFVRLYLEYREHLSQTGQTVWSE